MVLPILIEIETHMAEDLKSSKIYGAVILPVSHLRCIQEVNLLIGCQ